MATAYRTTELNKDNELEMPEDIRQRLNLKPGDSVVWSIDDVGAVRVRRHRTAAELEGIFKLLPGVQADDDFGNIIREAMDAEADRIVADMNRECGDE